MATTVSQTEAEGAAATTQIRDFSRVLVQVAGAWSSKTSGWRTLPRLQAISASEGFGPALGDALIVQRFGVLKEPDGTLIRSYAPGMDNRADSIARPLGGMYVRLALRTAAIDSTGGSPAAPSGSDFHYDGGVYTPFWYGVITEQTLLPGAESNRDVGGQSAWRALGIGQVLHRRIPHDGHELDADGVVAETGRMPVFNDFDAGDRSASKVGLSGLPIGSAYVHDRRGGGSPWTAADVIEYLLYAQAATLGTRLTWTLTGNTTALAYSERWDLSGLSVFECLARLMAGRRGLGYRCQIALDSGDLVGQIHVDTGTPDAITVGSYTIPAASNPQAVDFRGQLWHDDHPVIRVDDSNVYDEIIIQGERPWIVLPLYWAADGSGDLAKGWSSAEETAWDDAGSAVRAEPAYERVWRRFVVKDSWVGRILWNEVGIVGTTDIGIRMYLHRASSAAAQQALHGPDGFNGDRSYVVPAVGGDLVVTPARASIQLTRLLPVYQGYNYDEELDGVDTLPSAVDRSRPFVGPFVFLSADGTTWVDKTLDYQVMIDDRDLGIMIGRNVADAAAIEALIDNDDGGLIATVAIREPHPLQVSWRRASGDKPSDQWRSITIPAPGLEQWLAFKGSPFRVLDDGLEQLGATKTLRDDTDDLKSLLRLARLWYENPAYTVQWREAGTIDIGADLRPGALMTTARLGDRTITVNASITRRSWDFQEATFGTSYSVERILSDIRAIV